MYICILYICIYVYMYICICVYVYMCIRVYVYMCICVYVRCVCVLYRDQEIHTQPSRSTSLTRFSWITLLMVCIAHKSPVCGRIFQTGLAPEKPMDVAKEGKENLVGDIEWYIRWNMWFVFFLVFLWG